MKDLIIIAAIGKNNEIGKNNNLIWKTKEDMQFFRKITTGHYIMMGRKTYESLPNILPNRTHIVLTHTNTKLEDGIIKCNSMDEFFELTKKIDEDIYIIGGGKIYSELINYCNKMYLTIFENICQDADTFFPKINNEEWKEELLGRYEENNNKYLRKVYTRKK